METLYIADCLHLKYYLMDKKYMNFMVKLLWHYTNYDLHVIIKRISNVVINEICAFKVYTLTKYKYTTYFVTLVNDSTNVSKS